jgi:hypothetical protein
MGGTLDADFELSPDTGGLSGFFSLFNDSAVDSTY